jgi:DNA modification methylase
MNVLNQRITDQWAMYHGDSCEAIKGLPDGKIGFTIFSPPFTNLYIYSDSLRDMGNCKDSGEFFDHFSFLIPELLRITIPGRLCAVHCKDLPTYMGRDGMAGLDDFPGEIVRRFKSFGWSFHSRITIWKCPVTERERTNNNGLLHATAVRDRSQLRQGMADFLLVFRKWPTSGLMSDEPVRRYPIKFDADGEEIQTPNVAFTEYIGECDPAIDMSHPSPYARKKRKDGDVGQSINIWQRYADPIWWDINQARVLNTDIARDDKDEKHICPLQLDVIERAVDLWSNKGDIVFSPFAGIGSEGYGSVRLGRRFIGIELKQSYYIQACRNLERAAMEAGGDFFGMEISQ